MFVLTVLEWVEVNYVSPCCFMVITTFLQLFFHNLYYCIKKSSSHFKPFLFINILWNLVSLWSDILCYIRIFYFPKLFNKLWFCYITFLFPKIIQQNMILLHYFEFCQKNNWLRFQWSGIHISNSVLLWQDYTTVLKNQGNFDYVWRKVFEAIKIWFHRY